MAAKISTRIHTVTLSQKDLFCKTADAEYRENEVLTKGINADTMKPEKVNKVFHVPNIVNWR